MKTVWIGLGGALGSMARFHLSSVVGKSAGTSFPVGTLAVNVLGSFLLALLVSLAARGTVSEDTQVILATGVLGGFTTYSAFNQESLRLLADGRWGTGLAYLAATLLLCLGAGLGGLLLAR